MGLVGLGPRRQACPRRAAGTARPGRRPWRGSRSTPVAAAARRPADRTGLAPRGRWRDPTTSRRAPRAFINLLDAGYARTSSPRTRKTGQRIKDRGFDVTPADPIFDFGEVRLRQAESQLHAVGQSPAWRWRVNTLRSQARDGLTGAIARPTTSPATTSARSLPLRKIISDEEPCFV